MQYDIDYVNSAMCWCGTVKWMRTMDGRPQYLIDISSQMQAVNRGKVNGAHEHVFQHPVDWIFHEFDAMNEVGDAISEIDWVWADCPYARYK